MNEAVRRTYEQLTNAVQSQVKARNDLRTLMIKADVQLSNLQNLIMLLEIMHPEIVDERNRCEEPGIAITN